MGIKKYDLVRQRHGFQFCFSKLYIYIHNLNTHQTPIIKLNTYYTLVGTFSFFERGFLVAILNSKKLDLDLKTFI